MPSDQKYFLLYQYRWIIDNSPLKLIQKSRQVGITYADAYHSVRLASRAGARYDVFVTSRDRFQAKLNIEDCKNWAEILHLLVQDLGEMVFDEAQNASAYVLQFANGRRIYSLSSNPNALAGKRGHIKLDEFALHLDQRLLYRVAKPVTTWGGTLSIISTHRGVGSVFNQLVRDILDHGNPMGWSLHTVSLQLAIEEGLVERINAKTGRHESRAEFAARLHAECIDEEQWSQEYCCLPADESSAFISYEMLTACEDPTLRLMDLGQFSEYAIRNTQYGFYLGLDVARKTNLCVFYVGEKIGDVMVDRLRLDLQNTPFAEIRSTLYRILHLPAVRRACLDSSGMGAQLAEEAKSQFGWKVDPVQFTAPLKEELAFALRADFEDRKLRIVHDEKLRADLRGIKKQVTAAGNIRFDGDCEDSHCDRFWALALRQHAARSLPSAGALVL
jgi:phage FluMu gp28-like protein